MKNFEGGWKKLSSKIVYHDPWVELQVDKVIKPSGKEGTYAILKTNGPQVTIVPLTFKGEVYLVGQYRYPTKLYSFEVPTGNSDGESLLKAAKRELLEEVGLKAKIWKKLGRFQSFSGVSDEIGHVFLAKGLTKQDRDHNQADDFIIQIKKVSFKKALRMIQAGEITDLQTIGALFMAMLKLKIKP